MPDDRFGTDLSLAVMMAWRGGDLASATECFDRTRELAERIRAQPLVVAALLGLAEATHVDDRRHIALALPQDAPDALAELPEPGTLVGSPSEQSVRP